MVAADPAKANDERKAPASGALNGPRQRWREISITAGAAALVMLFAASMLALDPSYFWRDDFQTNYLPQLQQVAKAIQHGEFPLLVPGNWQSGAIGGEFQFGIFSPWSLACVSGVFSLGLSLPSTAALLSIIHLGLLAGGACRLARGRGLPIPESVFVAIVAALNGWIWVWGAMTWFVALAGLAWLPWAWWSLERALSEKAGRGRSLAAGLLIALLITGGWHFAGLMIGVVSAVLLVRSMIAGRLVPACRVMFIAWSVGLGLSAPAWLMLLEYSPYTLRAQVAAGHISWVWSVPPRALPALLLPAAACSWASFTTFLPHVCIELAGAFIPLAALAAAIGHLRWNDRRRIGWDFGLAAIVLVLAMSPCVGNFRWSFRWLPLLFLSLSLAAGHGLALLRAAPVSPAVVGRYALALAIAGVLFGIGVEEGSMALVLRYGIVQIACCGLWACAFGRIGRVIGPCLPAALTLASLWPLYAQPARYLEIPTWRFEPDSSWRDSFSPEVTYLGVYSNSTVYDVPDGLLDCYGGNSFLYEGLSFINGYSPLRLASLSKLFGFSVSGAMSNDAALRMLHQEAGPDGLLALLGVDGLLVVGAQDSADDVLAHEGWRLTATRKTAAVWHRQSRPSQRIRVLEHVEWEPDSANVLARLSEKRQGPLPFLVQSALPSSALSLGRADVQIVRESRSSIELAIDRATPDRSVLVAVSRPWYPGYVAKLNGEPVPVYQLDLAIPVVLLPPGATGTVTLEYWPKSLHRGLCLVVATVFGILIVLVQSRFDRRALMHQAGC